MAATVQCRKCGIHFRYPVSVGLHERCICFICQPDMVNGLQVAMGPDPAPDVIRFPAQGQSESADRKACPLFSGCLNYFPDALLAVARLSKLGNDKHNPGEPLHWSKGKSGDHADCLARHLLRHGQIDPDSGLSHTVAVAWRALALLQTEIEASRKGGV